HRPPPQAPLRELEHGRARRRRTLRAPHPERGARRRHTGGGSAQAVIALRARHGGDFVPSVGLPLPGAAAPGPRSIPWVPQYGGVVTSEPCVTSWVPTVRGPSALRRAGGSSAGRPPSS